MTIASPSLPTRSSPLSFRALRSREWFFLLCITALAALFRFTCLSQPSLWNDEAMTFSRICGTYDQMLQVLREDGFGPLHYELYWLLMQRFHMTPFMMRLWPALTGTLMIPAIYFFARHLLGTKVARVAALLAASSAFLMAFSRDAKMYMPLWFFITLHFACFLWWMRTGRATVLLASIAAGCWACGIHFTGLIILPLDLLIGLTGPNLTWKKALLLALQILLILAGPIGYATHFNQMRQRVDEMGWHATQIGWVAERTGGHGPDALAADVGGCFAFAFTWLDENGVRVWVPCFIMGLAAGLLAFISAALIAGAISWRKSEVVFPPAASLDRFRALLWLSVWILLPAYGCYRASVPASTGWRDWTASLWQTLIDPHIGRWILPGLVVAFLMTWWRGTRLALALIGTILLCWSVTLVVNKAMLTDIFTTVFPPVWLIGDPPDPYSFAGKHFRWFWEYPVAPIGAAVALSAIAWTGSSLRPSRRWITPLGIAIILAVLALGCEAIDNMLRGMDLHSVWLPRYLGFMIPAVIIAASALLLRLPFAPLRWTVLTVIIAANLVAGFAHVFVDNEPPIDKLAQDVIAAMNNPESTLTFTAIPTPRMGPHAGGAITDACGAYYLYMLSRKPVTPEEFREYNLGAYFPINQDTEPQSVVSAVANQPHAQNLIVWDGIQTDETRSPEHILPKLEHSWHLKSQVLHPVRCFWDWGELYTFRRREYIKDR